MSERRHRAVNKTVVMAAVMLAVVFFCLLFLRGCRGCETAGMTGTETAAGTSVTQTEESPEQGETGTAVSTEESAEGGVVVSTEASAETGTESMGEAETVLSETGSAESETVGAGAAVLPETVPSVPETAGTMVTGIAIPETAVTGTVVTETAVSETAVPETTAPVTEAPETAVPSAATRAPETPAAAPSQTEPAATEHVHTWVEVTMTVHHEAVYETVFHEAEVRWVVDREAYDEPYEITETVIHWVCKGCEAKGILTFLDEMSPEEENAHALEHMRNGEESGSYSHSFQVVTGTGVIHHEEEGHEEVVRPAYAEQRLVREAYDEPVTITRCSGCGATR